MNTNVMQVGGLITNVKTIGERFKWARDQRGMSQEDAATAAGVSQGTVGNLESGIRKKPRDLLSLARAVRARPEWLENGRGPWEVDDANVASVDLGKAVPLISWVQAGTFCDVEDWLPPGEADEWVEPQASTPGKHAFALRVVGDSMTSPIPGDRSFPDGAVIIVDPERSAGPGDFVVAKDVDTQQATFKRLMHDGGRWFLKPLNPSYPTVEIDDPGIRVIGRVIEFRIGGKL